MLYLLLATKNQTNVQTLMGNQTKNPGCTLAEARSHVRASFWLRGVVSDYTSVHANVDLRGFFTE